MIYMLKDGAIAESGTHEELMELDGSYRHLYESQMALENYGGRMSEKVTSDSLDREVQR